MEHQFNGPAYTIGIEEELMILDGSTLELVNAIESLLEPAEVGEIKPELMESVLEISTEPCETLKQADQQLRVLRRQVIETAREKGMAIGAAGTHPFAHWEDQRIVARPRYRDLVSALRFVARQELIFGVHVHVGIDDPDKAIHVANGMRVHIPVLLGLSANSPFWRGDATGLASTRHPVFRAFPRVGIPPTYDGWEDYARRIEFMINAKVIDDYTYLWHDVRPHPNFGTVEVRVMDSQTRVEHTLGMAALVQALVKELCEHFERGEPLAKYPFEMLDENKWLAARHGLEGELVDLPSSERVGTRALARRLLDRVRGHAQDLGSEDELDAIDDLLENGSGAARQLVVYEANRDMRELMAEIVDATGRPARAQPDDAGAAHLSEAGCRARGPARGAPPAPLYNRAKTMSTGNPDLFVICRSCGSEVSPYITECPYCGNRLRKRAPKLDRLGRVAEKRRHRPPTPSLPRLRRGEIPGIRGDSRPYATAVLVVLGMVGYLVWRTGRVGIDQVAIIHARPETHWWRLITAPFVYDNLGYAFVGIGTIAIYGWLLERRHGLLPVLALFAIGGIGGTAATAAIYSSPVALGGNGAALALLVAWLIPDLLALNRGHEIDGDVLGTVLIGVVVALMPLVVADPAPSWVADGVGVLGGVAIGLPLALTQEL